MKQLIPTICKTWDKVIPGGYDNTDRETRTPYEKSFLKELEKVIPERKGKLTRKDYLKLEDWNYHQENKLFIENNWFVKGTF